MAVVDNVSHHGKYTAEQRSLADAADCSNSGNKRRICRDRQQRQLSDHGQNCTGENQIALAELLDERCENHNNDYLRDVFRQIEHAVIFVVAENVLCVVGCNCAVYGLVNRKEQGCEQDHQKVLVVNECAEANACRQLFCFLCCLGVDTLLGAEEAPQQQADSDYRVDERYLDPRCLIAAHAVDDRQRSCGNNHVADRRHCHAEQVDAGKILLVAGHQRSHCAVGQVQCGVDHGRTQVIGDKDVNRLHSRCCIWGQAEQRNGGNAVRKCHPEHPRSASSVLGMHLVHDKADRHIGNTVKNTRNEHYHTDHSRRYAHDVGVEVRDQTAGECEYYVACNIAHTVGDLFKDAGFYICACIALHSLSCCCHVFLPFSFSFLCERFPAGLLVFMLTVYSQMRRRNTEKPEYRSRYSGGFSA